MSDAERIEQSRHNRAAMERRLGCVPHSILQISRGALSRSLFQYQAERRSDVPKMTYVDDTGQFRSTRAGAAQTDRTVLSIMPAELVAFFVKYYSRPGAVYLDPFMGQGVQMQVAKKFGLDYHGYDCSTQFFAYIEGVRERIDDGKTTIACTLGDSRFPVAIPDGIGDFSFHSPPYWDIEYYGDEPEQLGHGQSYEDFIASMEAIARAWLPKFKSGCYHVVNVNDFRKGGRFYAYHSDLTSAFTRAGWVLHDVWIIHGLVGGLPKAFAVDFNMKRIAPKVHEYALVFRRA